jgi:hypothetical protein
MGYDDLEQEALVELPHRLETTGSSTITVSQTAVAFNSGGGDDGDGGASTYANNGASIDA